MAELKSPMAEVERRESEPTRVSVSVGYKMNMGNYESANVNISVSTSALPGEKAGEQVDRVFGLVEAKLVEKFDEMKRELSEAGLGDN